MLLRGYEPKSVSFVSVFEIIRFAGRVVDPSRRCASWEEKLPGRLSFAVALGARRRC